MSESGGGMVFRRSFCMKSLHSFGKERIIAIHKKKIEIGHD
jgi:hypothetical protein